MITDRAKSTAPAPPAEWESVPWVEYVRVKAAFAGHHLPPRARVIDILTAYCPALGRTEFLDTTSTGYENWCRALEELVELHPVASCRAPLKAGTRNGFTRVVSAVLLVDGVIAGETLSGVLLLLMPDL